MIAQIKRIRGIFVYVLMLCLLAAFVIPSVKTYNAFAEGETVYSDVLEDLQKDENFKLENYNSKENDYSINLIQIAESDNEELFVYTYEPSRETKERNATSINISTGIDTKLRYFNYKLKLLSSSGVFAKYLVENFTVSSDVLRYYDISAIYRKWDNDIDSGVIGGNGSEKAYTVACVYSAATIGQTVAYSRRETEIIEIRAEDRFDGSIRYSNGFKLYVDKCDAWFVAFRTDRRIDDLMEADIYWVEKDYTYQFALGVGESERYSEPRENYKTIKATDEAGNDASGLFAKKRTWNRIEKASDFISKEDLTDEAKTQLKTKQWVLRFTETPYTVSSAPNATTEYSTQISDVTILRLMFETDGVVYNLGVVSDKVSPDQIPDNKQPNLDKKGCAGINAKNWWKYVLLGIVVILVLVLVITFFPHIVTFVIWLVKLIGKLIYYLLKGIWIAISAPFKGIAKLVRRHKDKKQ